MSDWGKWDRRVRNLILYLVGAALVAHELWVAREPHLITLTFAASVIGLPLALWADEWHSGGREPKPTKERSGEFIPPWYRIMRLVGRFSPRLFDRYMDWLIDHEDDWHPKRPTEAKREPSRTKTSKPSRTFAVGRWWEKQSDGQWFPMRKDHPHELDSGLLGSGRLDPVYRRPDKKPPKMPEGHEEWSPDELELIQAMVADGQMSRSTARSALAHMDCNCGWCYDCKAKYEALWDGRPGG